MHRFSCCSQALVVLACLFSYAQGEDLPPQIQKALDDTPAEQRAAMEFLVAYMPPRDLQSLTADFLLENVDYAYRALNEAPWKEDVPEDIFLNDVLPYASINEGREQWRKDFYERFKPLVKDAKTPSHAAAILNQQIYSILNVRYSTERKRADQAPYESIKSGLASCTGLSILLIDACRAVGVPARFAGTPLWSNKSGNHSWVEVWDKGWHFTGAAEPTGDQLDQAWFIGNASEAQRDHRLHAIYAVSYRHTPQHFPLVWDRSIDYVFAVNVTDRYTARATATPDGHVKVAIRAVDRATNKRQAAAIKVLDESGNVIFEDTTKDERFDANDHLIAVLPQDQSYRVELQIDGRSVQDKLTAESRDEPVTLYIDAAKEVDRGAEVGQECPSDQEAVELLRKYLALNVDERGVISEQPFATMPLTRQQADEAAQLLWDDHVAMVRTTREAEMEARKLVDGELTMPFHYQVFGDKPAGGRSLYISMHGGGGAPPEVNDRQWENQKRLYTLEEGVYLVPRAPTNTWDLWHQGHIDRMFGRLIENMIVFEDVNPNRVYIMGYSAGGDGVYQLAPRMADRLAAASMMAGHPNETSPLGLRNIAFSLHVGELDGAYNRNEVARSWQQQLADLQMADAEGYVHLAKIYPGKGHWLDREDAAAVAWMAQYSRKLLPDRIVWRQDDVTHTRFYWLAIRADEAKAGSEIIVQRAGHEVQILKSDVKYLTIRLNDSLMDMQQPLQVVASGEQVFAGCVERTIGVLAKTLAERGDREAMMSGEVEVEL